MLQRYSLPLCDSRQLPRKQPLRADLTNGRCLARHICKAGAVTQQTDSSGLISISRRSVHTVGWDLRFALFSQISSSGSRRKLHAARRTQDGGQRDKKQRRRKQRRRDPNKPG